MQLVDLAAFSVRDLSNASALLAVAEQAGVAAEDLAGLITAEIKQRRKLDQPQPRQSTCPECGGADVRHCCVEALTWCDSCKWSDADA